MGIIGSIRVDERSITRDHAVYTITAKDISYSDLYYGGAPVSICANQDQILINYYNGENYHYTELETITTIHEYQIDPEKAMVRVFKFSFIPKDKVITERVIDPVVSYIIPYKTAIALVLNGDFNDMDPNELTASILRHYPVFAHRNRVYRFISVFSRLNAGVTIDDPAEYTQTTFGVVALYSSSDVVVEKDQTIAKNLARSILKL